MLFRVYGNSEVVHSTVGSIMLSMAQQNVILQGKGRGHWKKYSFTAQHNDLNKIVTANESL